MSPAAPVALIDGWAVRAEQVADAGPYAPVRLDPAPAWVDAGGAMPAGTDAVLPPDAVTDAEVHASRDGGRRRARGRRGCDAGSAAAPRGRKAARRRCGGAAGGRRDAASWCASRACASSRCRVAMPRRSRSRARYRRMAPWSFSCARSNVRSPTSRPMSSSRSAAPAPDARMTVSRCSDGMGEVAIHGFGIAPGETAALGAAKGHPVLMLPGRLDAALAAFLVVGDALLRALTGAATSGRHAGDARAQDRLDRRHCRSRAGAPRRRRRRAARLGLLADAGADARRRLGAGAAGERRLRGRHASSRCGRSHERRPATRRRRCSMRCARPRGRSSSSKSSRPRKPRRVSRSISICRRSAPRPSRSPMRSAACWRRRRGADRRAAVRPRQCRRLCAARRRHGRRERCNAAPPHAQCRGARLRPRAEAHRRARHRDRDRDRRRGAARRRRRGDDRAHRADRCRGPAIDLRRAAAPGQFISYAGSDIARGETLLRRGAQISSREIGMLAACGFDRIDVVRRPKVAVLSTGDELAALGSPLRPGAVYDSNGAIIAAAVREAGGEPVAFGAFPDDEDALEAAVRKALDACDIVVLSGGTSKGAGDLSHRIVSRLGKPGVIVHGVALKPGKPLCLAVAQRQADRGAAGLSDLGDFHVPCLRRAGDPREGRPAAGSRRDGGRDRAGAHSLRDGPQGIRAGRAGRGRDGPDRVSARQGLGLGHDLLAGRRLSRSRRAAQRGRCRARTRR